MESKRDRYSNFHSGHSILSRPRSSEIVPIQPVSRKKIYQISYLPRLSSFAHEDATHSNSSKSFAAAARSLALSKSTNLKHACWSLAIHPRLYVVCGKNHMRQLDHTWHYYRDTPSHIRPACKLRYVLGSNTMRTCVAELAST